MLTNMFFPHKKFLKYYSFRNTLAMIVRNKIIINLRKLFETFQKMSLPWPVCFPATIRIMFCICEM